MTLAKLICTATICGFSALSLAAIEQDQNDSLSSSIDAEACPESFYHINLPTGGKLCQVFAADFPASMIFFVPLPPQNVVEFYQNQGELFSSSKQVKDRFMMQSEDKNTTLIISTDGDGAQVDVLVKKS